MGFLGLELPSWRGRGHGRLGRVGFDVAGLGMFGIVVSLASWPVGLIGAWVLMVGSVAFLFFDTHPARAWFALPYGAAWVAVGYLLWSRGGSAAEQPSRVR
jgi:hypothetical protein